MSGLAVAGLGFGAMLVLIALRAPVGLSMLVVGAVGYIHLSSWQALFAYMKVNPYYQFANYTLSVIPLFILMGALA
jgi:C4-dicarboxylate transporter DctM subunit